jgi:hypothetical protein
MRRFRHYPVALLFLVNARARARVVGLAGRIQRRGPFRGPSVMWRLVCFNDPLVERRAGATPVTFTDGSLQKFLQDLHARPRFDLNTGGTLSQLRADGPNTTVSLLAISMEACWLPG